MMKMLEHFRERLRFHESEATKYRTTIAMIEEASVPERRASVRRKINGALAEHLHTRVLTVPVEDGSVSLVGPKRKRKTSGGHRPVPDGYVAHAVGKMSIADAIAKALANGPLGQVDLRPQVDKLRGTPTNPNSLLVSCAKLASDGQIVMGKAKKGVYALKRHKDRIAAVEAKLSRTNGLQPPA